MKPPTSPIAEIYQHIVARCLNPAENVLVFEFVQQGDLHGFIENSIAEIEVIVHDLRASNNLKVDKIKTIAYSFLKKFNEQLSKVEETEKKELLKKLLVKIARGIMLEIQQQAPSYVDQVRISIEHGLAQAVYVEGYNQKDFENYFQLNYTDISKTEITITTIPTPVIIEISEYLLWDHKKANINSFIYLLQNDYACIKSKAEFQSLFDQQTRKELVRWDGKQTDLLILLTNRLYELGYIQLKGGKGLWKLVLNRFVDFDKNPLDIEPAKRLSLLKGKKSLKPALVEDVERIINHIKVGA